MVGSPGPTITFTRAVPGPACGVSNVTSDSGMCGMSGLPGQASSAADRPTWPGVSAWQRSGPHRQGTGPDRTVEARRSRAGPCPFRSRRESQERSLTGSHGQPRMPPDLRRRGQRGMTIQFPSWTETRPTRAGPGAGDGEHQGAKPGALVGSHAGSHRDERPSDCPD